MVTLKSIPGAKKRQMQGKLIPGKKNVLPVRSSDPNSPVS